MMKFSLLCIVVLLNWQEGFLQRVDYTNHYILKSADRVDLLKALSLGENQNDFVESLIPDNTEILLKPSAAQTVLKWLDASNVKYQIVTEDLQKNIEEDMAPSANWFESYHRFDDLNKWLEDMAKEFPKYCSLFDIGKSYEGRPLKVLKMTGAPNHCKQKPSIWIDSGNHAREWISHSTNTFLIEKLLLEYKTDDEVREIRDNYDFYFLVTMNPDGYDYSWDKNRMWRKSRKPVAHSGCIGTDTNRNFDHQWNTIGTSNNPCSQTYAGPAAFSDPEAKAVADFILKKGAIWDIFLTIHSYGHLLLAPWGYTKDLPEDYPDLETVGKATVKTMNNVHGKKYRFGTSAGILYESSGTSRDWAKGVAKIPYVYTLELRNENSFVLPPTEIIPTGQEIWAGLKTLVSTVKTITPPFCKPYFHWF